MIKLTRLNNSTFVLNAELIEIVFGSPDTVITTVNGKSYVVKESVEEVIESVIQYKNKVFSSKLINEK